AKRNNRATEEKSGKDGMFTSESEFSDDMMAIRRDFVSEKSTRSNEGRRWGRADLDHPTWNVRGKSPSSKMNLHDWLHWLHALPPADIYVLRYV
ncbi:hypothetical protein Tco_1558647, partial [Tanacetum coccineum]